MVDLNATDVWNRLSAEFPREIISWRAQNLTKDGDKALALAYIDARDVMERLDEAVGPSNWQDRYEVHGSKTICYLSIRVNDEWITKADGAGDSDVEAEKGAISDALKRAAVKWGVGRYLYAITSPWVPCSSYARQDGKLVWKKWTADPWDFVKDAAKAPRSPAGGKAIELATSAAQSHWTAIASSLSLCTTRTQLTGEWARHEPVFMLLPEHFQSELKEHFLTIREGLPDPKAAKAGPAPNGAPATPDFSNLDTRPS